jgi:glycosyltransferase involved in cell wall biosynthesis
MERLRARVVQLGLEAQVTLSGYLGAEALARAYARADVFVLPTYWIEGFPTSITEALQAGLPVVTTPIRGTADHLEEGVHALFVPPRDVAALARTLERILEDDALRERMGRNCRAKLEDFSPRTVAREYLSEVEGIRTAAGIPPRGAR